jgi:DNA-binding PadR family transcriptional regulator
MARRTRELGRFTDVALLVLVSLAEGQKHGYRMIHDIEEFSGTALEPGTLYGALMRLEQRGWIEPVESSERRKPYRITEDGCGALREQLATLRRVEQTGAGRLNIAWGLS